MTNQEIHDKIDANNAMIETLMTPSKFVLNNAVAELIKENTELQKQCIHEFKDGYCIHCYTKED